MIILFYLPSTNWSKRGLNFQTAMGARRNFTRRGQTRHFSYPFQFADDAMQMHIHKTLYPFYTPQRDCPMLRQQSQKYSSLAAMLFSLILLFTPYKNRRLTAMGSHCLAALPVTDVCVE